MGLPIIGREVLLNILVDYLVFKFVNKTLTRNVNREGYQGEGYLAVT